jgi:hypothetical protein
MSDASDPDAGLTPGQLEYSYLFRQEWLVSFGIEAVLYGALMILSIPRCRFQGYAEDI